MLAQNSTPAASRVAILVGACALLTAALSSISSGTVVEAAALPRHTAVQSASVAEVGAVYVTNTTGVPATVSQFGFDRQGLLTPLAPASVGSGLVPVAVAVDVAVKSVYVTNFDNSLSQYDINSLTGALSPKTPATVSTGQTPTGVAVSPDGKSVYVSNDQDNDVSMYNVDALTGRLTPKNPATVAAGKEPSSVAVTPNGRSVYVSNASDNSVSMYNVNPVTGVLSSKAPATVAGDGGPRSIAITPNGESAFVTNSNQGDNSVSQYDINPSTGLLSPKVPAAVPAGAQPEGITIGPDGTSAYVCNIGDSTISQYDINRLTGALTPKSPATVTAFGSIDDVVSPDGTGLYATNYLGGGVSQYNVSPVTGALSLKTPPTVATTGANPEGIAVVALPLAPVHALAAHNVVTGLPDVPPGSVFSGVGPFGLVFDNHHHLLFTDAANLGFYAVPATGSSSPMPLSTGNVQTGLTWGKHGELFAARFQAGDIVQVDPRSGAVVRDLVAPGSYPCVTGLATDPVSGDLFFGQPNSGGACPGAPALTRVENPTSAHPTFVSYSAPPGTYTIDVAFAPDGTLYAVEQGPSIACAARISGTRSPTPPTVTTLACFPNFGIFAGIDTIAVSAKPRHAPTLFVAGPDGTINEIDQTTTPPTVTPIFAGGTRTDGMLVGPDHCLYATQSTNIEKLTNVDGSCSFVPVRYPGHGRIG